MGACQYIRTLIVLLFSSLWIETVMADSCPHPCSCEGDANLEVNCSARLLLTLPPLSISTLTLDLSNNALGPIINTSFPQMPNLTSIDLSHNALSRLLGCTFSGMLGLKTVLLHNNKLSSLPDSLFTDANLVEHLDISHNMFTQLPDDAFRNAHKLKSLDISHNHIAELKLGPRFQVPRLIERLDLSYNHFQVVTEDSFSIAMNWEGGIKRSIHIAHCRITDIAEGAFQKIPYLNDIDLSGNSGISIDSLSSLIKELENKPLERLSLTHMNISTVVPLFDDVSTISLKFFNVSFNKIEDIPANTFSTIRSLRVLDLSHNLISELGPGFSDLRNLRVLNISSNNMKSFRGNPVTSLLNLIVLDVSYNELKGSDNVTFSPLSKLKYLDVNNNLLTSIVLPRNASNLFYLDYHSNSITEFSGVDEATHLEFFDISDNALESVQPFLFKGAMYMKLANFSRNGITSLDHQAFLPQSPLTIDLSQNDLKSLRFSNWVATQKLYLNHNLLSDLDIQTFSRMTGLKVLDLSNNKLTGLHEHLFEYLTDLKYLNLSHNSIDKSLWFQLFRNLELLETLDLGFNNLSTLNESLFLPLPNIQFLSFRNNKLATIIPKVFRDLAKIKLIDLSNNPFDCSCDLLAFRDWLIRTKIPIRGLYTMNSSAYTCQNPPQRIGVHLTKWDSQEFECNKSMLYMIIFSSLGTFLIIAGVVGTAAYRFYISWKQKRNTKRKYHEKTKLDGQGGEKKVDRMRLSSMEIAEEIREAILRKDKRNPQDKDRSNSYTPWPGAADRWKGLNKDRKKEDDRKIHQDGRHSSRVVAHERENSGRKYERVADNAWDSGGKRERRDEHGERSHRLSESIHGRDAFVERRPRERGKDGDRREFDYVSSRDFHPERRRDSTNREHYLRDRNRMERERGIYYDEEHRYRNQYGPRRVQGPYIISSSQTMPIRRDKIDDWGGPRVWTIQGYGRYPKDHEKDQRSAGYRTLPVGREMHRHERDRRQDINRDVFPHEVRFEEQNPRYYSYERDDGQDYRRYRRSQSYNYLPQDHREQGSEERVQREYESIDQANAPSRIGPRAASQPYLASANTSGWL